MILCGGLYKVEISAMLPPRATIEKEGQVLGQWRLLIQLEYVSNPPRFAEHRAWWKHFHVKALHRARRKEAYDC